MARGGVNDIVLDDTALKLEGHLSVLAARAAAVHPTASTEHAHGAYVSVRERTTKARMAFLVGPMARIGARCIEHDGPALVTGGCFSVLVIQAATGVSRALVVHA